MDLQAAAGLTPAALIHVATNNDLGSPRPLLVGSSGEGINRAHSPKLNTIPNRAS